MKNAKGFSFKAKLLPILFKTYLLFIGKVDDILFGAVGMVTWTYDLYVFAFANIFLCSVHCFILCLGTHAICNLDTVIGLEQMVL